jgi:hypothetical protein
MIPEIQTTGNNTDQWLRHREIIVRTISVIISHIIMLQHFSLARTSQPNSFPPWSPNFRSFLLRLVEVVPAMIMIRNKQVMTFLCWLISFIASLPKKVFTLAKWVSLITIMTSRRRRRLRRSPSWLNMTASNLLVLENMIAVRKLKCFRRYLSFWLRKSPQNQRGKSKYTNRLHQIFILAMETNLFKFMNHSNSKLITKDIKEVARAAAAA